MEEFNVEEFEIKPKKRKQAGFWKGFFCATLLFMLITAICFGVVLFVKTRVIFTNSSNLVTQNSAVQTKLAKLETYIRGYYIDEIDDEQLEDYLYYGLVAEILTLLTITKKKPRACWIPAVETTAESEQSFLRIW